jgi:hypothetical protein
MFIFSVFNRFYIYNKVKLKINIKCIKYHKLHKVFVNNLKVIYLKIERKLNKLIVLIHHKIQLTFQ